MNAETSETLTLRLHRFFRAAVSTGLAGDHPVFLGGTPGTSPLNRWSLVGLDARRVLKLHGDTLTVESEATQTLTTHMLQQPGELLTYCRSFQSQCPVLSPVVLKEGTHSPAILPFSGGLVGVLGYDASRWLTPGWSQPLPSAGHSADTVVNPPDLLLIHCRYWLLADGDSGQVVLLSENPAECKAIMALWQASHASDRTVTLPDSWETHPLLFSESLDETAFARAVDGLQQHIRQGNIYQANLAIRFQSELNLDLLSLYETLCHQNPSPFSAFVGWPQGALVCNSPERLVRTTPDGQAETRPIAGTRGRGNKDTDDTAVGALLLQNEKESAEHLMLVDLERNDLGRVCRAGSVAVDELMALERYSHVTHLVSNIRGELKPDTDAWDVLAVMFPGGTITGCPKLRCLEILADTEPVSRGLYTGSVFWMDAATGCLDSNIIIRSLQCNASQTPAGYNGQWRVALHAGAGIVADSVAGYEYRECRRKAEAMFSALSRLHQKESRTALTSH